MADVLVTCLGNTLALHLKAVMLWTTHLCLNLFLIRYFFHVSDFIATLSDCHSKLSWGMLANFNFMATSCINSEK